MTAFANEITPEQVHANLMRVWIWRGPLYELCANSMMLDYAPDFAKLHPGVRTAFDPAFPPSGRRSTAMEVPRALRVRGR